MLSLSEIILNLSTVSNVSEKTEPFYDEFVEKQLLAGNISSRHLSLTLASVIVVLPAADHGKVCSTPLLSTRIQGIHPVASQQSLQSIQEQVKLALDTY